MRQTSTGGGRCTIRSGEPEGGAEGNRNRRAFDLGTDAICRRAPGGNRLKKDALRRVERGKTVIFRLHYREFHGEKKEMCPLKATSAEKSREDSNADQSASRRCLIQEEGKNMKLSLDCISPGDQRQPV